MNQLLPPPEVAVAKSYQPIKVETKVFRALKLLAEYHGVEVQVLASKLLKPVIHKQMVAMKEGLDVDFDDDSDDAGDDEPPPRTRRHK